MKKSIRGFTLIEAMIVVAILGIIVAIGYPSYREYVMKSRRVEGLGGLLELSDRLERYYTDRSTYGGIQADDHFGAPSGDGMHLTERGTYKLNINASDAVSFTISAIPQGPQTKDKCGTFTLTHSGTKQSGGLVSECWK